MKREITVIYPNDKILKAPLSRKEKKAAVEEALESAWRLLQRIDQPNQFLDEHEARSSMVGDIYVYKTYGSHGMTTSRYFIVEPCGFREVSKRYADDWEQLDRVEQCFGTEHAERNGKISKDAENFSPTINA